MTAIKKAEPRTLYVRRDVVNADEIIKWAKAQGFKTTLPAGEMHVTVTFSRVPVDWMKMGQAYTYGPSDSDRAKGEIVIGEGGPRLVDELGDPAKPAIVLLFASSELTWRHEDMIRNGASWDYYEYQPHITITYEPGDVDIDTVEPYRGKIALGPEIFEEVKEDWADDVVEKALSKVGARHSRGDTAMLQKIHDHAVELGASCPENYMGKIDAKVIKVDRALGLVFGWAIICKQNGQDYYDLNIDDGGERVPEHIPEPAMLKAATDFMENSRVAKEMHTGEETGSYVFAFPLTTDIAKAMGIVTKTTGLMVAMKPSDKTILDKYASGEFRGFSIGGQRVRTEEIAA